MTETRRHRVTSELAQKARCPDQLEAGFLEELAPGVSLHIFLDIFEYFSQCTFSYLSLESCVAPLSSLSFASCTVGYH